jgi:endo-1,4-beta-xylanase
MGPLGDDFWIPTFFPGFGAALLFDTNFEPKPAHAALIEELSR